MFKHLTDFSYKRNWKEALGFYLAYAFLGLVLLVVIGEIIALPYSSPTATFDQGYKLGQSIGSVLAPIYCLVIACLLLIKKKFYKNFGYILLGILTGALGLAGGVILGLIIPAVMTTKSLSSSEAVSPLVQKAFDR